MGFWDMTGEMDAENKLFNYAVWLHQSGDLVSAENCYKQVIAKNPLNAEAIHFIGVIAAQSGRTKEAIALITQAINLDPKNANAYKNRALAWREEGVLESAANDFLRASSLSPEDIDAKYHYGSILLEMLQYKDAVECLKTIIKLGYQSPMIYNDAGNALCGLKNLPDALAMYKKAIELDPNYADAYYNLGSVYQSNKQFDDAISQYDEALRVNPRHFEALNNKALSLEACGQLDAALESYDRAIKICPGYAEAYVNRANLLVELKKVDLAITSCNKGIFLQPMRSEFYVNRASALCEVNRYQEAVHDYDRAIALNPALTDAFVDKAGALLSMRQYQAASITYKKAFELDVNYPYLRGMKMYANLVICDWECHLEDKYDLVDKIKSTSRAITPFHALSIIDNLSLQQKISRKYIEDKFPEKGGDFHFKIPAVTNKRIKIAYFSGDFRSHPVASLLVGVIEGHDKNQFETIAFSFHRRTDEEVYLRLCTSFERFIHVENLSDEAIIKLARDMDVDIAVDLSGFTQHSRTGIFAQRVAPIQVNYLGYAGTMGCNYMDYIVADQVTIPQECRQYFTEKVAYLPNSFMPSDSTRKISQRRFTREEAGLPDDCVVFCCFNSSYKISPQVFSLWMNILQSVENSVLWLSRNNSVAQENLKLEAKKHNVDAERLIFASVIESADEHLARYRCADLFLDTFPYNAHATANDALWAGLPVLTCMSSTFAGRTAASLLDAVGLPELITTNAIEYQELAISLGNNISKLADIRARLEENLFTEPLFNTSMYVGHIEALYIAMFNRHAAGLPPAHLEVNGGMSILN